LFWLVLPAFSKPAQAAPPLPPPPRKGQNAQKRLLNRELSGVFPKNTVFGRI
jgi:hypothetical protein